MLTFREQSRLNCSIILTERVYQGYALLAITVLMHRQLLKILTVLKVITVLKVAGHQLLVTMELLVITSDLLVR